MLLLPALNQMIDITTTRSVAMQNHPPSIIFIMLIFLALLSALLAGYSGLQQQQDPHARVCRHPFNHRIRHFGP